MASFLFPIGETILSAVEAGAAGNMINAVYNEFKEPAKKLITDEGGKLVGDYARNNPNGYVDNMVEKAYNHRKKRGRRVG